MANPPSTYRPGEAVHCAACHQDSVVKLATKMDGWRPLGQFYVCAICGATFAPVETTSGPAAGANQRRQQDLDRLSAFLDQPAVELRSPDQFMGIESKQTPFCKECRHFYHHPFGDKCLLHERAAQPLGDCPQFDRRSKTKADSS